MNKKATIKRSKVVSTAKSPQIAKTKNEAVAAKSTKAFWQKGRVDTPLLILVAILMVVGLVTLFSASVPLSISESSTNSPFEHIKQQLIYTVAFLPFAFIVSKLGIDYLRKIAGPLYIISIILMGVALLQDNIYGARRWIDVGAMFSLPIKFSFQPSEIAKLAVILMLALKLIKDPKINKKLESGFWPCFVIIAIMAGLMVVQRHISGLILVTGIGVSMMFVGGVRYRYIALMILVGAAVLVTMVLFVPKFNAYIMPRLQTWWDPTSVDSDESYQVIQSLIAIGSGGITGRGLGQSIQKHLYLPAMTNDFIFAIFCEEFGFIGASILVALFVALIVRCIWLSTKVKDRFASLLMLGIAVQIGLQALLHIAVNINAFPCTGISLPFFSDGGTSLLILLFEVSVMLSVSRKVDYEKQAAEIKQVNEENKVDEKEYVAVRGGY